MLRYYIDTCIWVDFYEERKGYNSEPLGKYAFDLLTKIIARKEILVVSNVVIEELCNRLSLDKLNSMMMPFMRYIFRVRLTEAQHEEAKEMIQGRDIPLGDAKHAIIARDSSSILVTRDKHFKILADISEPYTPEELI
jgi:predicted nucleic acid-binding protein